MKKEIWLSLLIIPIAFFGMLYIIVPVVQKIWMLLVFPHYQHELYAGYILFVSCVSQLIRYKNSKETKTFIENLQTLISYYILTLIIWGFAYLYTFFI